MPNWCHNTLTVTGDADLVKGFAERASNGERQPLSFQNIVPEPENIGDAWYAWRLSNWGSKWDASFHGGDRFAAVVGSTADVDTTVDAMGVVQASEAAIYKFDTAWGPPVEFVLQASNEFRGLTFTLRYAEVGNGIAGEVVVTGGEAIEDKELPIDEVLAPEEMWF